MIFRRSVQLSLLCLIIVSLSACLATHDTAKTPATPSAVVLDDIVHTVAAIYGEHQPQVTGIKMTLTDSTNASMCLITLQGNFHKAQLQATGLEFSMLTDGTKVWALRAFTATNPQVWIDDTVPVTH